MLKPQRLRPGDKAAVVSLSSGMLGEEQFIHKYHLAKERLERDYGLQVVAMPNALKGGDYLYRHPEARAQDLMDAFRDPSIKAVFSAIGGDDTIRLLPYIDFDVLKNNPKIFTGFSDTTTNHFMMHKAGLVSYYGGAVMNNWAEYVSINEYTAEAIDKILFHPQDTWTIPASGFCSYETDKVWWDEANIGRTIPRFPNTGYEILQGTGRVSGPLLGGCIDVFEMLFGTPLWPDPEEWRGKLLLAGCRGLGKLQYNLTEIPRAYLIKLVLILFLNGIVDIASPLYRACPIESCTVHRNLVVFIPYIASGEFKLYAHLPVFPVECVVNSGILYGATVPAHTLELAGQ